MKGLLALGAAAIVAAGAANAQNITLSHSAGTPGGSSDIAAKNLAEVAATNKIATIQVQIGRR